MAATTTAFTACDALVEIDNSGGTLTDISGSSNALSVNFDRPIGEFKVFGTDWKSRVQCGKDASYTLKGIATTTATEISDLINDWFFNGSGPRSFRFSLPDGTVGNDQYDCEVLLVSYSFDLDGGSADPIIYSIELVPTGAVTFAEIT